MKTDLFNDNSKEAIALAEKASKELGHGFVGTEHLLYALAVTDGAAKAALSFYGVTGESILPYVRSLVASGRRRFTDSTGRTPEARRVLDLAYYEAKSARSELVGTGHILLSVLRENGCFAYRILEMLLDDPSLVKSKLSEHPDDGAVPPAENETDAPVSDTGRGFPMHFINLPEAPAAGENGPEIGAEAFCRDLTALAAEGLIDPLIGCENELSRLIQTLLRRTKNNPVLVGKPGVGKSAIAEGFAVRIHEGSVPDELKNARLLKLDIGSLIAGTKYRGEFEDRLKKLLDSLTENDILFIDEIHMIVGAGAAEGSVDAANILKPMLARGTLRLIGATTFDEYRKYIERDAALERRFSPITVEEPTREEALRILLGLRSRYEKHHGIVIDDDALAACVDLSIRCMPDRCLPDKAIDLLDESAAHLRLSGVPCREADTELRQKLEEAVEKGDHALASQLRAEEKRLAAAKNEKQSPVLRLGAQAVAETAYELTGIPAENIGSGFNLRVTELEKKLAADFHGSRGALSDIANAVRSGFAGLSDPARPVASIIIAGSPGTGKTTLAGLIADALYNDRGALIRFDMNDYSDETASVRLLGSPTGYKDSEEGGALTEAVRRKPYAIVLFDDMERASDEVYAIAERIARDGFLQDGRGRSVSFRSTVFIMTFGVGPAGRTAGFAKDTAKASSLGAVPHRLSSAADLTVMLDPIGEDTAVEIASDALRALSSRAEARAVHIGFDKSAAEELVRRTGEAKLREHGGHAIMRSAALHAEKPLAEMMLSGALRPGLKCVFTASVGELLIKPEDGQEQ